MRTGEPVLRCNIVPHSGSRRMNIDSPDESSLFLVLASSVSFCIQGKDEEFTAK